MEFLAHQENKIERYFLKIKILNCVFKVFSASLNPWTANIVNYLNNFLTYEILLIAQGPKKSIENLELMLFVHHILINFFK